MATSSSTTTIDIPVSSSSLSNIAEKSVVSSNTNTDILLPAYVQERIRQFLAMNNFMQAKILYDSWKNYNLKNK